jgi:PUA-domain protein
MSMKIKNRHRLKKRDIKILQKDLEQTFSRGIDLGSAVDIGDVEGYHIVFVDDEPCFTLYKERPQFTVQGLLHYSPQKKYVVIDMGAIKFVTNGADVMAPGIVDADPEITPGDQVWICDETHHKPLASGIALMNGTDMIHDTTGKAVQVVHYLGDTVWRITAKSL